MSALQELLKERVNILLSSLESFYTDKEKIERIVSLMTVALKQGNKLLFMANGGAASTCEHLSAEFTGRFLKKRKGYPSIALTANSADVTAIGNDFGFENIFSRQIEAFAKPGDVVIGMTTSGNSPNVVEGLKMARAMKVISIVFTGNGGGEVAKYADYVLMGPSGTSGPIQEAHMILGHCICHLVDEQL